MKEEMSADEIHNKLRLTGNGLGGSKLGELIEYFEELFSSKKFSPQIASELADIAYYAVHINTPSEDKLEYLINAFNIDKHGIKLGPILSFCIIKYSTRLIHGDESNYKQTEYGMLKKYLLIHPEIAKSWQNRKVTELPPNSEIMRTYADILG